MVVTCARPVTARVVASALAHGGLAFCFCLRAFVDFLWARCVLGFFVVCVVDWLWARFLFLFVLIFVFLIGCGPGFSFWLPLDLVENLLISFVN